MNGMERKLMSLKTSSIGKEAKEIRNIDETSV
jgi:hypothetical protein